jgi:shikimate 5-dehydrogenase
MIDSMSDSDLLRYSRHILLPELDMEGQQKLLDSHVLVIGLGGLGSPVLQYLAASGIGHLYLVDDDVVELSNVQRQICHGSEDVGRFEPKSALIADNKGLADLELIAQQAREYLVNGGWLLMEHGYDQQQAVQDILMALGYQQVSTRIDLGGNPRITGGRFFK